MTKYGRLIAEIVLSSQDHPTAEEIYQRILATGKKVSVATVYNNLKSLVEEGILTKVVLEGSPDRYDKASRHHHLICDRCGKLQDVMLRDLTEELEADTDSPVLSYDIRIRSLCPKCRADLNSDKK